VLELLAPVTLEYRGPCFVLPDGLPRDERAREIGPGERFDWPDAFPWLAAEFEAVAPVAIAFDGGHPAAICHSPRGRTDRACEAGVEALAPFRGRGLATAAVACWADAVQRSGRLALYSTSWENRASRRIASRLSARVCGENWHVT
jgi:RimJ/RimL family protein N-acetyltransferase